MIVPVWVSWLRRVLLQARAFGKRGERTIAAGQTHQNGNDGENGRAAAIPSASSGRPARRMWRLFGRAAERGPTRRSATSSSAPEMARTQDGGSPFPCGGSRGVSKRNCVAARRGGEQRKENDQSITTSRHTGTRELDSVGAARASLLEMTKPVAAGKTRWQPEDLRSRH